MARYIEMIYLGKSGDGHKTGVGVEFETNDATTKAFEQSRCHDMDINEALFIMDLHEDDETMVDSIAVSAKSFTEITGEPVLSEAEYAEFDNNYWAGARALFKAA